MNIFDFYRNNVYHTSSGTNEPTYWFTNYFFRRMLLSTVFAQKVLDQSLVNVSSNADINISPTDQDIPSGVPINIDNSVDFNSLLVPSSDTELDYFTASPIFKYYSIGCIPATAFGIGTALDSSEYPFASNSELKETGKYHYLIGTSANYQLSPWYFIQDTQAALQQKVVLLNPPRMYIQGNPKYGDVSNPIEWLTATRNDWQNMTYPMLPFEVIRGELANPPAVNQLVNVSFESYINFDNFASESDATDIYNLTRLKIELNINNSDISSTLIGTSVDTTSDGKVRIGNYVYLNSVTLFDQYFQPLLIGVFPIIPISEGMPIQVTFYANLDTRNIY